MKVLALGRDLVGARTTAVRRAAGGGGPGGLGLYQGDLLREVYFRADSPNGSWFSRSRTSPLPAPRSTACPLVGGRLIDFDLVPLKPYPGFRTALREG